MNEREFRLLFLMLAVSFADIDRKYNLPRGTARLAISMPNKKGEQALSDVLNRPLYFLFPNRYKEDGKRLRPQPTHRYLSWAEEDALKCDISAFSEDELFRLRYKFHIAPKNAG